MHRAGDQDRPAPRAPDALTDECKMLTAAALFDQLWNSLAEVLGTAATSILLKRAVKRAAPSNPELRQLSIYQEGLEHKYTVPPTWYREDDDAPPALCALLRALRPLLIELTGSVVIQRLERIPALMQRGIGPAEEDHK